MDEDLLADPCACCGERGVVDGCEGECAQCYETATQIDKVWEARVTELEWAAHQTIEEARKKGVTLAILEHALRRFRTDDALTVRSETHRTTEGK